MKRILVLLLFLLPILLFCTSCSRQEIRGDGISARIEEIAYCDGVLSGTIVLTPDTIPLPPDGVSVEEFLENYADQFSGSITYGKMTQPLVIKSRLVRASATEFYAELGFSQGLWQKEVSARMPISVSLEGFSNDFRFTLPPDTAE